MQFRLTNSQRYGTQSSTEHRQTKRCTRERYD